MLSIRKINPMVRAIGTMGVVAGLVGAVTFAQLQSSPVVLADNTISTTASLQISNGGAYGDSVSGFTFAGVVPGGQHSDSHTFYIENNGNVPLTLNVTSSLPTFNVSVDNTKVYPNISCTSGSSGDFSLTGVSIATLNASGATMSGGQLANGDAATCSIDVGMDSGAVTSGNTNSISTSPGFDLNFTGTNGS